MKHKSFQPRRRVKKQKPSQKKSQNENFFEAQIQRKCEKCEEDKGVQKKSEGQSATSTKSFFGHYMNSINGKGSALSRPDRTFFEGKLGDNFGDVKLHADTEAAKAAKDIGAKAFTWQNHIVVNRAYYDEGSVEGKQLLAHELKHVQQQRNGKHIIQMMPEEETAAPNQEEGVHEGPTTDLAALEKEAEQEEEKVMIPESIADFQTFGTPFTETAFANSVTFRGQTDATFDGGVGSTRNLSRTASEECTSCTENDCFHYTGKLVINYSVSTNITLPDVPPGLSECQHQRVRDAIDNTLAPHEDQHVTAFDQYNGTVTLPIDYTGCSAGINDYVQQLHDADAATRRAAAEAASAALDPFHVSVDMDCEDEPAAAAPPSAPGSGSRPVS